MNESDVINTVSEAVRDAVLEFFHGDRKAAAQWLSKPCKALGNTSPINSIAEFGDDQNVLKVIGGLTYGVFQ